MITVNKLSKILMYAMLALITGCASVSNVTGLSGFRDSKANYIGTAQGMYAAVHYRVEDNNLVLAFENTTTTAMGNLIIAVEQRTASGDVETQSSTRLLKVRNFKHITLSVPPNATGDVYVRYFFSPVQEGGIAMAPYQKDNFGNPDVYNDYGNMLDDTVNFRIITSGF